MALLDSAALAATNLSLADLFVELEALLNRSSTDVCDADDEYGTFWRNTTDLIRSHRKEAMAGCSTTDEENEYEISWTFLCRQIQYSLVVLACMIPFYFIAHQFVRKVKDLAANPENNVPILRKIIEKFESILGTPKFTPKNLLFLSLFWLQLICSAITVGGWVWKTYGRSVSSQQHQLDMACNWVYMFQLLLYSTKYEFSLTYLLSLEPIVDILTVVPLVLQRTTLKSWLTLAYLRVIRMLREVEKVDELGALDEFSDLMRGVFLTVFRFLGLVVVMAGSILLFELLGDTAWLHDIFFTTHFGDDISFYQMVYFVFVTISTVGYGDFSPSTILGRLACIVLILGGILFFSAAMGRLLELKNLEDQGQGQFNINPRKKTRHVVVFGGAVAESSVVTIRAFLEELIFGATSAPFIPQIVLMAYTQISFEFKDMISLPWARNHVTWLKGSPMNARDLNRTKIFHAQMVFVLCDISTMNPDKEDEDNIMRAIAIVRQHPTVSLRVMLLRPENRSLAVRCGLRASMCYAINELKANFLAQNTMLPTFACLVVNMVCRGDEVFKDEVLKTSFFEKHHVEPADRDWVREFVNGGSKEVYLTFLLDEYVGRGFGDITIDMYRKYGVLLLAVQHQSKVKIAPNNSMKYELRQPVFLIAANPYAVEAIKPKLKPGEAPAHEVYMIRNKLRKDGDASLKALMGRRLTSMDTLPAFVGGGRTASSQISKRPQRAKGTFKLPQFRQKDMSGEINFFGHVDSPEVSDNPLSLRKKAQDDAEKFEQKMQESMQQENQERTWRSELAELAPLEQGHIVLLVLDIGLWQQIKSFISPLRQPHLPMWRDIKVVYHPSMEVPLALRETKKCDWVSGDVNDIELLERVGILTAERVVIFSGRPSSHELLNMDQRTLLTINLLESLFKQKATVPLYFLTELHNPDNINQLHRPPAGSIPAAGQFINRDDERHTSAIMGPPRAGEDTREKILDRKAHLHPRYAAGHCIARPDMVRCFANAFSTPGILEIMEGLCAPFDSDQTMMPWTITVRRLLENVILSDRGEDFPSELSTFGEALEMLHNLTVPGPAAGARQGGLLLAIVRTAGTRDNPFEYPVTLPEPSMELTKADILFLLAPLEWAQEFIYHKAVKRRIDATMAASIISKQWKKGRKLRERRSNVDLATTEDPMGETRPGSAAAARDSLRRVSMNIQHNMVNWADKARGIEESDVSSTSKEIIDRSIVTNHPVVNVPTGVMSAPSMKSKEPLSPAPNLKSHQLNDDEDWE